jgi:hypothetical protein
MVQRLAWLSKMKASLRVSSEELLAELDRSPDDKHALVCLRTIADCRNLEHDISALANAMLKSQEPKGSA